MSALTPDEQDQFVALGRLIFAQGYQPTPEQLAQYAGLRARKNGADVPARVASAPVATSTVIPPLPTVPAALAAAIPPRPAVPITVVPPRPTAPGAFDAKGMSLRWLAWMKTPPPRSRFIAGLIGAVTAGGVVALCMWALVPRPSAVYYAEQIERSELGDIAEHIGAYESDGTTYARIIGLGGGFILISDSAQSATCMQFVTESQSGTSIRGGSCANPGAVIVVDMSKEFFESSGQTSTTDELFANPDVRVIYKDGQLEVWDSPPSGRGAY